MIVVADSGGANIASVMYALDRLGVDARLSGDPDEVRRATRVILPGVGAAGDAMARLRANGLADVIPTLTQPVLGICLGMQLLYEGSEEDDTPCLGVLPGVARRFADDLVVPHMGWSPITPVRACPLLDGVEDGAHLYFVHSYALPVNEVTVATADHGGAFAAVAARDNFMAAQCHPERSADAGARLLANFLALESGRAACA